MKVHYINILLFALPLNILVNTHKKPCTTPKIPSNRSLCECELYAPANYDNDLEMKKVMDNFNKQTQQRFHEYDDRMIEKRQKCKEQCDKEIQKIILKDKLEKELMDKFATLQTDIQGDAIPTCFCEKSLADKVEKGCLKCAQNLGGIVAPSSGVLVGIAEGALYAWKPAALEAAIAAAKQAAIAAGEAAGLKEGMRVVISALQQTFRVEIFWPEMSKSIGKTIHYANAEKIANTIITKRAEICEASTNGTMCSNINDSFGLLDPETFKLIGDPSTEITNIINTVVRDAKTSAATETTKVIADKTPAFEKTYMGAVNTGFESSISSINAAIIAIVVIVLIMVIIYLILRYRRNKKMKKKLQYIKLLEE